MIWSYICTIVRTIVARHMMLNNSDESVLQHGFHLFSSIHCPSYKVYVVMIATTMHAYLCTLYIYLLHKAEKPSVHLHSLLVRLITLPSLHQSTPDLLEMKAMSSDINKFISKIF